MTANKKIPALRFKEFEEEWENSRMFEIANKVTDGTHDTPNKITEGVPFITAIHVRDGNISFNECYYVSQKDHEEIYKRCNPEKGDLLMVNIGAGTATCAIVNVDYQFSLKNVALIKPDKKKINSSYLTQYQRQQTKRLFNQLTSGGAQPFLSLNTIGKLKVYFPTLSEQQKVADFLTSVDNKIQQLTKKKTLLEQYKKGVMQQIFNQQIRFKDDDGNDYPDWGEKKLKEIMNSIKAGKTKPENEGLFNVFGSTGIIGYCKEFSHNGLFILIARVGANAGKLDIVSGKFGVTDNTLVVEGNSDVNLKFFFYSLYNYNLNKLVFGSGQPLITGGQLSKLLIFNPSKEEQQKIANFLTDLDKKIDLVNQQLEKTKEFKKGLLQQMFV